MNLYLYLKLAAVLIAGITSGMLYALTDMVFVALCVWPMVVSVFWFIEDLETAERQNLLEAVERLDDS